MSLLDLQYLYKVEKFMDSGDMAFEFEHGDEQKRFQILEFLETLMDVADKADETATRLIFTDTYVDGAAISSKENDQK
jgi:hypothetical protein